MKGNVEVKGRHLSRLCLFLVLGLGLTSGVSGMEGEGVDPPKNMALFILSGQSNMDGRGSLEGYIQPDTDGRVFLYDWSGIWRPAEEPLSGRGVGPGLAFACELIKRDSSLVVGLVPCAVGGTPISWWQKGHPVRTLYKKMMRRAEAVKGYGDFAGLLFYQGERDAAQDSTGRPNEWADLFATFVSDVRSDLGQPDLPIVFAQIGAVDEAGPDAAIVRAQQEQVALPDVAMIRTLDLPLADDWHFPTNVYAEVGRRFAKAWLELAGKIERRM